MGDKKGHFIRESKKYEVVHKLYGEIQIMAWLWRKEGRYIRQLPGYVRNRRFRFDPDLKLFEELEKRNA